jgi:hypothetical protein
MPAGGIAADGDAAGINPQRRGIRENPARGGDGIVERRRPFVFRRQAIIHRHDNKAALMRDQAAKPVMGVEIAHDKTAAMEKDHRRQRFAARGDGSIDAGADIARRTGNGDVLDLAHRHIMRPHHLHHLREGLAAHRKRHVPHFRARHGRRLIEKGFHQRIEGHEGSFGRRPYANAFGPRRTCEVTGIRACFG